VYCINLNIKNDLNELQRISEALTQLAQMRNFPESLIYDINLAIDELVTNIINYGFTDNREHIIEVCLEEDDMFLITNIKDDGIAFNPLENPDPDTSILLEDKPIGGLGIYFVRKKIDHISYRRENNFNILTLKKKKQFN